MKHRLDVAEALLPFLLIAAVVATLVLTQVCGVKPHREDGSMRLSDVLNALESGLRAPVPRVDATELRRMSAEYNGPMITFKGRSVGDPWTMFLLLHDTDSSTDRLLVDTKQDHADLLAAYEDGFAKTGDPVEKAAKNLAFLTHVACIPACGAETRAMFGPKVQRWTWEAIIRDSHDRNPLLALVDLLTSDPREARGRVKPNDVN